MQQPAAPGFPPFLPEDVDEAELQVDPEQAAIFDWAGWRQQRRLSLLQMIARGLVSQS